MRVRIPTVSISIAKDLTEGVVVPRAVFVKWPLGHPFSESDNAAQQRTIIFDALSLPLSAQDARRVIEPGYHWRRETYREPDWAKLR